MAERKLWLSLPMVDRLAVMWDRLSVLWREHESDKPIEGDRQWPTGDDGIELAVLAADITDATSMSVKFAYYDVTTAMPVARDGAEAFTAHVPLLYHTDTLIDGPDRDPPVEGEYTQPRLAQVIGVYVKHDAYGTAKAREADADADEVWLVVGHFQKSSTNCP